MFSPQSIWQRTGSILKPEIPSGNVLIAHANLLSVSKDKADPVGLDSTNKTALKGKKYSLPWWGNISVMGQGGVLATAHNSCVIKFSRPRPVDFLPSIKRHNITQLSLFTFTWGQSCQQSTKLMNMLARKIPRTCCSTKMFWTMCLHGAYGASTFFKG